ncbi:AAA family ATPase [Thalassotalea sp. ND16A]|uniref:AAA family ATPase n=1 Tax=Thalassotalea sp. ND16A TaxID=1535422 RepID=UPI00051A2EEB|nr:AAA family ATPase [Thalassotalea sp. ND16A]KGJ99888.1 hypothetical protein ND16A_3676 [Thalassotalea sp. ND16A]
MEQLNLFEQPSSLSSTATKIKAELIEGYGSPTELSFGQFKNIKGIDRHPLWGNIFTTGDILELAGQQGVGKSYFLYKLIFALTTGGEFFNNSVPSPNKVLLLDGELPIDDINQRFEQITSIATAQEISLLDNNLNIINREFCGGMMKNICTISSNDELFEKMCQHDIVVIDSLKTNSFGSNISNADDVADLISLFLKLKAQGTTVIYVNHLTKSQTVLGSVDFDIINDVTIALSFDPKRTVDCRKLSILKGRKLGEQEKQPVFYEFSPITPGIPFYRI